VIGTVLVALANLPAVLAVGALLDGWWYRVPLTGAVVLAAGLAWLSARRFASVSLACVVGLAAGLAYAVGVTEVTGGSVALAVRALWDGWPRLLGVLPPARPGALLLVPLGLVVYVPTYLAVLVAVRTRQPLAPALPPLLGLSVALLLVGHRGPGGRLTQLLLMAGCLALTVAAATLRAAPSARSGGASPEQTGATVQPTAGAGFRGANLVSVGLASAGLVVLVGLGAGLLAPVAAERFDPRDHVHPPVTDIALLNPLGLVRGQLETSPPRQVFTVRLDTPGGRTPADRVAIAELGGFDGARWSDDGGFVLVDRALPTVSTTPALTAGQADVHLRITLAAPGGLGGLDSRLLPTVGRATAMSGPSGESWAGTAFEPASGALAALDAPRADTSYTLTAKVPDPSRDQLARALPATGAAAAPYTSLPPGPAALLAALRATAVAATSSAGQPSAKLTALAAYLRDGARFPYDLSASPGHSYGVLNRLLTGTGAGDRRGYAEQHATAFAVLARALGFPTRVAVGYLLDDRRRAADGTFTVTTAQAHAWPEVLLDGLGWVPFEPTDLTDLTRALPPSSEPNGSTGSGPAAQTQAQAQVQPPLISPPLVAPDDASWRGGSGGAPWLLIPLLVLVLVPVSIPGAKRARAARRRRRGGATARVDGAWRETRDRLGEYGVPRARTFTGGQVVGAVAGRPALAAAAEPLARLAALVDQAWYHSSARFSDEHAAAAWHAHREVRAALWRAHRPARRLRAALDPRTLLPAGGAR
jgi:hypothetical protein